MLDSFEPKYESQSEILQIIDKMFFNKLKKRDLLIDKSESLNYQEIKSLDLQISMCIKKRAKVTKGGFNYILTEMWDWKPYYLMDYKLLPKITRCLSAESRADDT
tara:strand:- start:731 stop:1045 length:315 start_codon:yes stop_codon:yes gene_type:complete